jgi:rhodanese-related sulfurtransferase
MIKLLVVLLVPLLLAGTASAETVTGRFLFHSKAGKVVGITSPSGLMALNDGPKMQVSGVSSPGDLKPCDEVEIDFTRNGKQLVINAIAFKKAAETATCGPKLEPTPLAVLNKALADKSATILDVRGPEEYAEAHLDGAISIPLAEVEARYPELPKVKPIIIYCHSGVRAAFASALLQEHGIGSSYVKGKFTVKDGKPQIIAE